MSGCAWMHVKWRACMCGKAVETGRMRMQVAPMVSSSIQLLCLGLTRTAAVRADGWLRGVLTAQMPGLH